VRTRWRVCPTRMQSPPAAPRRPTLVLRAMRSGAPSAATRAARGPARSSDRSPARGPDRGLVRVRSAESPPEPGSLSPLLLRLDALLRERGWHESSTPWTHNSAAIVRGRWVGRRLRLAQWPGEEKLTIRLALRGGPEVTVRRATLFQRLDPRNSADRALLGPLFLQGYPGGVGRLLRQPARVLLKCLFAELRIDELRLGSRWARIQRRCEPDLTQALYFTERLLDVLAALGNATDPPLDPRLSLRAAEVLRCPYCHDSLHLSREQAASCGACGTLHHSSCALEASRCTTLGCPSLVFVAQAPGGGAPVGPGAALRGRPPSWGDFGPRPQ
jgi:hypothetical protein